MKKVIWICGVAALELLLASTANAATSYSYDALGRISVVTYDNGKQIVYTYDAAGNRSQVVTQTGTNQPPVAVRDSASTAENVPVVIHTLTNDTDPDGDTLTIQSVSTAPHGTASITGSGTTVTFTPTTGYSGPDSFGYTISDGHGHVASAPVTVTMVNQPPVAVNDGVSAAIGGSGTVAVLANDSDPEGDPLTVTSVTTPSRGTATINADNTVTYTPAGGSNTPDSFTYYIADDHRNTAHATVSVTVTGSNRPPVANPDDVYINHTGLPYQPVADFDPRINDTDPDGDPIIILSCTNGTLGSATVSGGGTSIHYLYNTTLNVPKETTDTFTYTISDGNGGTSTAAVTVHIEVISGD